MSDPAIRATEIAEAEQWLLDYAKFWSVRSRFYELAFGPAGNGVNGAAQQIPRAEELFLSLKPPVARELWAQALREAGHGLSPEIAAFLSNLSAKTRRAIAMAQADALGLTESGRQRFAPHIAIDDDEALSDGVWEWVARERIAEPQLAGP